MAKRNDKFGICRSCGRQIIWIKTKAGKNMPVDPALVNYRKPDSRTALEKMTAPDGGTSYRSPKDIKLEKIVTPDGEVVSAEKVDSGSAEGYGYISHFATCPNYRRK